MGENDMVAEMTHNRRVLVAAAVTVATGGLVLAGAAELRSSTPLSGGPLMSDPSSVATPSGLPGFVRSFVHRLAGDSAELPVEGQLPSFTGATSWLNSHPLTPEGLRGRVVFVDFWTYTCVNWLRTLPYVRAWDEKYAAQGLTTIGVHTPEFDFEHDVDNITAQADALRVPFPIAVDSDYGIWQAFDNHYWPAVYIADAQGRIRYHHFGEGEYAMQEMVIQQLLLEAGADDVNQDLVSVDPVGLEVAADYRTLHSPETYLGYGQATGLASPDGLRSDESHDYAPPSGLRLNQWAPSGSWAISRRAATATAPNARLAIRFQARDVNLVMGPAVRGTTIPFRVSIDGQPATGAHGTDVDADDNGTVTEQRTYQLIRQPAPISERVFEIEFLDPGVELFCFTFG
jgi:thiol-disulfide isomerase/thioredoxin